MKHSYAIIFATASLLLGSCATINKITGKDSASESTSTKTTVNAETVKPPKGNKNSDKNKTTGSDSRLTSSQQGKVPSTEELIGGQWLFASVGDKQINLEDNQPYIAFDANGRFYASDGCNIINGDYTIRTNGQMTFANVLSTMKYCPESDYAPAVTRVLADGAKYTSDSRRIGQDTYLYFKDSAGKTVATLRRHNMEFLNGNWQITSAEGMTVDTDEATLFIDIAELKVHGNTGCNFFNGDIYIDPLRSNAIDFSNMGLTRMACPHPERERAIMVALERAASAIAGKNSDTVLLLDSAGKEVMTLRRLPVDNNKD